MCLAILKAVDGGEGRVCRGASVTDNQPSYFRVLQGRADKSNRICITAGLLSLWTLPLLQLLTYLDTQFKLCIKLPSDNTDTVSFTIDFVS